MPGDRDDLLVQIPVSFDQRLLVVFCEIVGRSDSIVSFALQPVVSPHGVGLALQIAQGLRVPDELDFFFESACCAPPAQLIESRATFTYRTPAEHPVRRWGAAGCNAPGDLIEHAADRRFALVAYNCLHKRDEAGCVVT
ncbi:hypothetical protein D3C77_499860 [compost metagenome]